MDGYSLDDIDAARNAICKQRQQVKEASATKDEGHPVLILQKAMDGQS